ncbi:MAG: dienelactone hydrolase family protein [Novosphingobium sp.]|nr:dienelactone hydrolase family protein [Novosphingobium sp.]
MSGLEQCPYRDGDVALTGWLAKPAGPARAAIAVFPTIANITPRVAQKAALLAEAGFLVLVADYYGAAAGEGANVQELAKELRTDNRVYRRRLASAIAALRALPEAAGLPVGAIGFCMGGQAALETARAGEVLAAVVSFHGLLGTAQRAGPGDAIRPRILVCHGDKDPMVPREHVLAFMQEMDAAGADWHLHIYSSARHGFTDPASDRRPLDAVAYDASADRQSWAAMLNFFGEIFPPKKGV